MDWEDGYDQWQVSEAERKEKQKRWEEIICTALLALIAVTFGLAKLAEGSETEKGNSPIVELGVSRKFVMPGQAIRLTLKVYNADEALWCPEIRWVWPDGTASTEESDCEPYKGQTEPQEWYKWVRFGSGTYDQVVELRKSNKVIHRASVRFKVVGGEE